MFDPDADPFLQSLAHFLLGLADMLVLVAEKLREFAAGLLQRARNGSAGQTEVKLSLKPGQHTLQLLLGDEAHLPHNPPVISERITVTVRAGVPFQY